MDIMKLFNMYKDANDEIRDYILGEVLRIESECSCGLMILN